MNIEHKIQNKGADVGFGENQQNEPKSQGRRRKEEDDQHHGNREIFLAELRNTEKQMALLTILPTPGPSFSTAPDFICCPPGVLINDPNKHSGQGAYGCQNNPDANVWAFHSAPTLFWNGFKISRKSRLMPGSEQGSVQQYTGHLVAGAQGGRDWARGRWWRHSLEF